MYRPADIENNLELYLHPIEIKLRDRFLEISRKHGNGIWSYDTLSWEVYIDGIDAYEALNEEEKYILNTYMQVLRKLYK